MAKTSIKKPGYKHTQLGWIPEEWEVKKISNVTSIYVGRDLKEANFSETRTDKFRYPVYSNTVDNKGLYGYYNFEEYVGECLTIVGRGAGLGTAFYRKGSFGAIGRLLILFPNDLINAKFISEYVNGNLKLYKEDSAIPQLTGEEIGKYSIPLPPLNEQNRISTILSAWDEAINKQQQLIDALQTRHRALMQQLLTGKKRLKGFKGEWKEVRLGDVFTERNETGYFDLPLLSITADRGVIYQSENDKKDTSNYDKSKYRRICIGDIGYNTMRMWQGRSALSRLEGIVSPAYTIVIPNKDQCPEFYASLFKVPFMINRFFCNSQGLVEDTLNCKYKDFSIIKVNIPLSKEQSAIADVLTTSEKEIQTHRRRLATLQEQKKGLMQVLLTGKVRVKV